MSDEMKAMAIKYGTIAAAALAGALVGHLTTRLLGGKKVKPVE